jgi:signal peptidase II
MSAAARQYEAATAGRWLVPAAVGLAALLADQLSKAWAVAALGPEPGARVVHLVGDWFNLVYGRNTGIAFGMFQDMPRLFTATSILITAGAVFAYAYHLPNRNPWVQAAVGLIVGGSLGNITDRLRHGYVVDFIQVGWWPIFNLADSAISVGVTLLACYLIFVGDEPAPAPRTPPRDDGLLSDLLSRDVE